MSRTACTIEQAQDQRLALINRYPQIDHLLLEELAADFLLDAVVDMDFEDIRVILDRPGRLVCSLEEVEGIDEVLDGIDRLASVMLPEGLSESSSPGAMLVVRSPTGINVAKMSEMMKRFCSRLRDLTDPIFGFYIDPNMQSITLRVVLTGVVLINRN